MYYVNFTNTQRQILRLLNITEKYWFVEYKFGVFSINHAWKEGVGSALCLILFYITLLIYQDSRSKVTMAAARGHNAHYNPSQNFIVSVHPNYIMEFHL